jgi:hypothetical protein
MKLNEDNQSEGVIHREDAISDPLDFSSSIQKYFDPAKTASIIGDWYKNATGYNPKAPEGSMAEQAGYNNIGRGFEDGGGVPGPGGLPQVSESENTDETPNTMVSGDNGGQTGTSGPQQGPFTPNEQALNDRETFLNKSGLGGAFKAAQQGGINTARQQNAQGDTSGQGPSEEEQAQESPFSPKGIIGGIGSAVSAASNILPGNYGNVAKRLSQEILDYAAQKYNGDPAGQYHGQVMDHPTAEAISASGNTDGSEANEAKKGLQLAFERGGSEPGLSYLQNRIAAWDSARSWVTAAYDGNNLQAAVDGMNKAIRYLPTDENLQFGVGKEGGVTATITNPDSEDVVHFNLTGPQFRELARGGTGFAYGLINDPASVLAKLSNENHDQWANPNSQGVAPGPNGVVPDNLKALGINQAMFNLAHQMYPWVSQGGQRMQFLASQVATKEKYAQELEVAKQGGVNRAQVAAVQGQFRQGVAETQVKGRENVEDARAASNERIANTREEGYLKKAAMQAKTANDKILASNAAGAALREARQNDIVLNGITHGTWTEDQAREFMKKNGRNLDELLTPQQGGTQAPQVKGGQGAAQVAQPKGGTPAGKNRFQIGVDKTGQPVYQYE